MLKSRAVAVNVFLVFIAFDGFSVNGVTEVAIESQMDDEIVQAFIDTDGSPVIQIALDQWACDSRMRLSAKHRSICRNAKTVC